MVGKVALLAQLGLLFYESNAAVGSSDGPSRKLPPPPPPPPRSAAQATQGSGQKPDPTADIHWKPPASWAKSSADSKEDDNTLSTSSSSKRLPPPPPPPPTSKYASAISEESKESTKVDALVNQLASTLSHPSQQADLKLYHDVSSEKQGDEDSLIDEKGMEPFHDDEDHELEEEMALGDAAVSHHHHDQPDRYIFRLDEGHNVVNRYNSNTQNQATSYNNRVSWESGNARLHDKPDNIENGLVHRGSVEWTSTTSPSARQQGVRFIEAPLDATSSSSTPQSEEGEGAEQSVNDNPNVIEDIPTEQSTTREEGHANSKPSSSSDPSTQDASYPFSSRKPQQAIDHLPQHRADSTHPQDQQQPPPRQAEQMQQQQPPQRQPQQGQGGQRPYSNRLPTQQLQQRPQPQSQKGAYRQPPPNQQRRTNPGGQPPKSNASGFSIKGLWRRVEKGYDSLADFETAVSGKATQLVSAVSTQVTPTRLSTRFQREGRTATTATKADPPGRQATTTPQVPKSAAKKQAPKTSAPSSQTQTTGALGSFGKRYEEAIARKKAAATKSEEEGTTKTMIRPVGGASDPSQYRSAASQSWQSGNLPQQHQQPQNPGMQPTVALSAQYMSHTPNSAINRPETRNGSGSGQGDSVPGAINGNPYLQQARPKPPQRQQPDKASSSQQRRDNRIPWSEAATSKSAQRPTGTKKPAEKAMSFDEDKVGFLSKLGKFVPRIPSPRKLFRNRSSTSYTGMDLWDADADEDKSARPGFFGIFRSGRSDKAGAQTTPAWRQKFDQQESLVPPLKSLTTRCKEGQNTCLMSSDDVIRAKSFGRKQASLDMVCALFLLVAAKEMPNFMSIPFSPSWSTSDIASKTIPVVGSVFAETLLSWAPFALAAAYLATKTNSVWFKPKIRSLASQVAKTVEDESMYGQLYLRLVTALPIDSKLATSIRAAAHGQIMSLVASSRLRSFISFVILLSMLTTATIIRPVITALWDALTLWILIPEWRSWPIPWKQAFAASANIWSSLFLTLKGAAATSASAVLDNPLQMFFFTIVLVALAAAHFLPALEEGRNVAPAADVDEEQGYGTPLESMDSLSKLGSSSANRLSMLSEEGSVENVLERWRLSTTASSDTEADMMSLLLRVSGLRLLALVVTLAPLFLFGLLNSSMSFVAKILARPGASNELELLWNSILEVAVIMSFTLMLAWNAIGKAVKSTVGRPPIMNFLSVLSSTVAEITKSNANQADISFNASLSPTAGILVRDLWAAHTSKRAWAVRGANFQCKNGEILVVLGDDGSGKTRLLTALAEGVIVPPRRSLSSNKVRGSISIGGVDVSKWDRSLLKRRTGILLNDIRTAADTASICSGLTLEEILEPVDGLKTLDPSRQVSASEKAAMMLSLKITGLYSSLLPKFPSKMSTVITANEEDLQPSALRPRSSVLSPSEWSKLLLAKVLAQTISDNDNSAGSPDKVANSLIGSILVLDDPTVLLSEAEEASLLNTLRTTGAAIVMSTNKWATGRFADCVVVVRDGAIVESGTHNELLNRGPQQSLYAAKWQAMTMQ